MAPTFTASALALAAALLALSSAVVVEMPGTLTEGMRCSTSTLNGANEKCVDGLQCVIYSWGMPANFIENAGVCRKVPATTALCSVDLCSSAGYTQVCLLSKTPLVATQCGAYPNRVDGGPKPVCTECPANEACAVPKPLGSDNKPYCSLCALKYASCKSNFQILGPVTPPASAARSLSPPCSTNGVKGLCAPGAVCLISEFGPTDNTGKCVADGNFAMCTVAFCSVSGPYAYCKTPFSNFAATCSAWSTRKDYGLKASCAISCKRNCDAVAEQVKDNKGTAYCSRCALRKASCESNFQLYGSFSNPIALPGFVCTTNNPTTGPVNCTAGHTCSINFFGYTMGGIANVGTCVPTVAVGDCTTAYCTGKPGTTGCKTVDTLDVTTCQAWKVRSDAGK